MAIAKGSKSKIGFVEESTFGTMPSDGFRNLPLSSEGIDENINTVESDDIRENRSTPTIRGGNKAAGGPITSDLTVRDQYKLFAHVLGGTLGSPTDINLPASCTWDSTTDPDGQVVYRGQLYDDGTHVWICVQGSGNLGSDLAEADVAATLQAITSPVAAQIVDITGDGTGTKWMYVTTTTTSIYHQFWNAGDIPAAGISIEKQIKGLGTDLFIQCAGGRINSANINIQQEAITKVTWNMLFSTVLRSGTAKDAAWTSSTPQESLAGFDVAVYLKSYSQTPSGDLVTVAMSDTTFNNALSEDYRLKVRDATIDLNNNFDETVFACGSRFREELPEGRRVASGRLSAYFLDQDEYEFFQDETKCSLIFNWINNGQMLQLEFPEVKLTGNGTPKISGQGVIVGEYDWTAFQTNAAKDIRINILSTTAF